MVIITHFNVFKKLLLSMLEIVTEWAPEYATTHLSYKYNTNNFISSYNKSSFEVSLLHYIHSHTLYLSKHYYNNNLACIDN